MTVSQHDVIDIVARDPDGTAVLGMVEEREWGDRGLLLPDLQAKLNTYYSYVIDGRLGTDFPALKDSRARIVLGGMHPPTRLELELLRVFEEEAFAPAGIAFGWSLLASA